MPGVDIDNVAYINSRPLFWLGVPLFAELERRQTPHVKIDATSHQYDTATGNGDYSLLFNRMSPSAYKRGHGHGIFYTLNYLSHLEQRGTRVEKWNVRRCAKVSGRIVVAK